MNPFDKYLKPEDVLQINVCKYVRYAYPFAVIHHSPNEGKRSKFERYLIGLLGVNPGFPDLIILDDDKRILFLELKAKKGNKVQSSQKWWNSTLLKFGFNSEICFGFDEAKEVIDDFFKR